MKRVIHVLAVAAVVLPALAACEVGPTASTGSTTSTTGSTDLENRSTAHGLAVIDTERPIGATDPLVGRYQRALDKAVSRCTQKADPVGTTPGVGDMAVHMAQVQPSAWTVLTALQGIALSIPAKGPKMNCIEIAAILLTSTDTS